MNKFAAGAAAIVALGLGAFVPVTSGSAQTATPEAVQSTAGSVTLDRARGGGGGGVRFHGGGGGGRIYGGGGGVRYYGGHRHHRGGRYIVPGIAAGIVGSAIVGSYYYGGRYWSCSELEYRCDRGEGWACHRLEVDPRC